MELAIIILLPIFHFILEAFHDFHVWKASDAEKYEHTIKWHLIDLFIKTLIYIAISIIYFDMWRVMIIYLIYAGCMRIVFLNGMFNVLRNDPVYYFSPDSNFIDKFLGEAPQLSYYGTAFLGIIAMILMILIKLL